MSIKSRTIASLFIVAIIYLLSSFIAWDFNAKAWGGGERAMFSAVIIAAVTAFNAAADDFKNPNKSKQ